MMRVPILPLIPWYIHKQQHFIPGNISELIVSDMLGIMLETASATAALTDVCSAVSSKRLETFFCSKYFLLIKINQAKISFNNRLMKDKIQMNIDR